MEKKEVHNRIHRPRINKILHAFFVPQTPRQVEIRLAIPKLKMKPFLSKGLLESLNPDGRKGRFYQLTDKAKRLLNLPINRKDNKKDWKLIGWVIASSRQRSVLLQTMSIDSVKRTSEEIRKRASKLNPRLTRMSTKTILNELIGKGLVETEMNGVYRNYWLSEQGRFLTEDII